jgi:hypothetical protein
MNKKAKREFASVTLFVPTYPGKFAFLGYFRIDLERIFEFF